MLKEIMICSIVLSVLVTMPGDARAEISASLWIPDEVLLKERYYGIVVMDSILETDTEFDIITDNEEVIHLVTETLVIPSGKHHGVIEFETKGTGSAQIFAIFQDTLLKSNVQVVESAASPTQLDLILPSNLVNVFVDENKNSGYVFLLNDFENPVVATKPVSIELTSNGEITLQQKSVTIEPGNHYAKFTFQAGGEGSITSTAANLLPDEETISVDDSDLIELHIAVAPEPVPTDSSAELYFWLERDSKPYLVPHDVKVTISIDKSTNLSFDSAIEGAIVLTPDSSSERRTVDPDAREVITRTEVQLARDSKKEFVIKEGTHFGKMQVYSSFDSASGISINGLAESINPDEDEEVVKTSDTLTISTESSNFGIGTQTQVFAYPDPAYDLVEIVVSSHSDDGPVIERLDEEFTVFTDSRLRLDAVNPTSIKKDSNYAIVTARVIDFGEVDIFAERNEAESDEITVTAAGKYVKDPDLEIVPLPVLYNTEQDLFLVISSHEKIITDPSSEEEGNLISITSRPSFVYKTTRDSESVLIVKGTISELLEEEPEVHVASNAFTASEVLEVYNPTRKKLESMHPRQIYPQEPFPIVNHETDLNQNPVRKAVLRVSSIANMSMIDELIYLNQTGTHDIIFYDKNSIPIKSSITVKGAPPPPKTPQQIQEESAPTVFTYNLVVTNGGGSGEYTEDTEVTISAPSTKDDIFIIKKKLVGWKDLPYTEPTATFEIDDNIETEPIYEDDYTYLFAIVGPAGVMGALVFVRKKKNGSNKETKSEEDIILEDMFREDKQ